MKTLWPCLKPGINTGKSTLSSTMNDNHLNMVFFYLFEHIISFAKGMEVITCKLKVIVIILLLTIIIHVPIRATDNNNGMRPPVFSKEGGFYDTSFSLKLMSEIPGSKIYYSLDGSIPTTQSLLYSEPIKISTQYIPSGITPQQIKEGVLPKYPLSYIDTNPIDSIKAGRWQPPQKEIFQGTVVRARVYKPDIGYSDVTTHTYFVEKHVSNRYTLPVVALTVDPLDFFDYERGIYIPGKWYYENHHGDNFWGIPYANYHQSGSEWERPVYMEYFELDGTYGFGLPLGARIHGGGTRMLPQKSIRLYARNDYSEEHNAIRYEIFRELNGTGADKPINRFKRLILRNGGQLFYGNLIGDAIGQSLISNTKLDTQASQYAIVFINGEYWGIHEFKERIDSRYIESHYDLEREDIVILDYNALLFHGDKGDQQHYKDMLKYIEDNDITKDDHYNYVNTLMDVNNYIQYQSFQIYINNSDWPGNNIKFWRSKNDYNPDAPYGQDGRWRWIVYDLDSSFGIGKDYKENALRNATQKNGPSWPNPDWSTFLFRSLLENKSFRNQFINVTCDAMNTYLNPDFTIHRIDEMVNVLMPEMQEHINRWGIYPAPSISEWLYNDNGSIKGLKNFAKLRPAIMKEHLNDFFNLKGTTTLTVEVSDAKGGNVQVNSILVDSGVTLGVNDSPDPWRGNYFRDIPITLTAVPKPGFKFERWEGVDNINQASIVIKLDKPQTVTAIFIKYPKLTETLSIDDGESVGIHSLDNSLSGSANVANGFRIFPYIVVVVIVIIGALIYKD